MWIFLSFIYAITNAFYTNYNNQRRYDGYVLGIWRGFGISLALSPLLLTVPLNINSNYMIILIIQGLLIGLYDSHIFFASARFGSNSGSGFMATSLLITVFLWWILEINDYRDLLKNPSYFITLMIILCAYSISYWNMMRVKVNKEAEVYLYPAVFALAFMSIATRYIAIHGGTMYNGIVYYLTIACFVSGIYNLILYLKNKKQILKSAYPTIKDGIKLIILSTILIAAKTAAMRLCENPGYVVAILLTSPVFTYIINERHLIISPSLVINISLLILLLILVG